MDNLDFNWSVRCPQMHLSDPTYNEARKCLGHILTRSLTDDRGQWWVGKCREMEKASAAAAAAAVGNYRNICRLIWSTGTQKPRVSEAIKESGITVIHSEDRWQARWAEHFWEQFNCPAVTMGLPFMPAIEPKHVDACPPSEMESIGKIGFV